MNNLQQMQIFREHRNGLMNATLYWLNKTLPYELSANHSQEQNDYIEKALRFVETISCVRFVRHTNESDYVSLSDAVGGCYSSVGRQGGKQILNLAPNKPGIGCFRNGTIIHEFLHGKLMIVIRRSTDEYDEIFLNIYFVFA